jgi:NADH-quinone oxidoreductase subunit H
MWLGGWLRPFPHTLSGETWDNLFSFVPGVTFLFLAALAFRATARMSNHAYFKFQKLGLGAFGLVLAVIGLVLFIQTDDINIRGKVQDIFWFVAKVAVFQYLYIWYRGTFPRYRFDQLMRVGWKVLLPLGIGVLMFTAIVGVIF